jgi:tRNA-splicing ligase RtcB (3'-phosphate/5'-hydroxy nucleic acid ligase)
MFRAKSMVTGKDLLDLGYKPGAWFKGAIEALNSMGDLSPQTLAAEVAKLAPPPPTRVPLRQEGLTYHVNLEPQDEAEASNLTAVQAHMRELLRVPTLVAGAIMPDACPAGTALGTIPVGGVVAAREAIHPGMHSADICCSMAATYFPASADPTAVLDAGMKLSHFGGGGRARESQIAPPAEILEAFEGNAYLRPNLEAAIAHFATQGDGNHFFYVGRVRSSGEIALVTHHGSRKPGALLYKIGMAVAQNFRGQLSPQTPEHNAWIPSETNEGRTYWSALQIVRDWTKASHYAIHDSVAAALGLPRRHRFWNEHNFVFRRSDGLFYHAKGATPAYADYADDASGLTLIPLNMAEPILVARGRDAAHGLGFAPHGAGRNFSRTAYMRANGGRPAAELIAEQAPDIDVRYFCGVPDVSELPGAYKSAKTVVAQIERFGLAEIADHIDPIGNIMAGDWQRDAPWRRKKGAAASSEA